MKSFVETYLIEVLGLSSVVASNPTHLDSIENKERVKNLLLVPDDISLAATGLVEKMAKMCPIQPTVVVKLSRGMGIDEIRNRLKQVPVDTAMVFGSDLFAKMYPGNESYYSFTNEKFDFYGVSVIASHDLEDMCTGPNVDFLKKQVWQQMKMLSRKS